MSDELIEYCALIAATIADEEARSDADDDRLDSLWCKMSSNDCGNASRFIVALKKEINIEVESE